MVTVMSRCVISTRLGGPGHSGRAQIWHLKRVNFKEVFRNTAEEKLWRILSKPSIPDCPVEGSAKAV
jgi:hypothetical protein